MKKLILVLVLLLGHGVYAQIPERISEFRQAEAAMKNKAAKKYLAQSDNYNRAEFSGWDVTYYALDLNPDITAEILYGRVQVNATLLSESMNMLGLTVWPGLIINSITLFDDSTNLDYVQKGDNDIFIIKFERTYYKGESISVVINYQGRPQDSQYFAFDFGQRLDKPMIWTLSEPYGARSWWPCKDTPTDKPDSMDIRVTVPNELTVVSNGSLQSKVANGEKTTWWWHEQYPIATYLVSLAIYDYEIHYDSYLYNDTADSMQIQFYNFPGVYESFANDMKKVKSMIKVYANLFGEYPFVKEKYAQADFLGGGAMEHQTCSSFSFFGEYVYAHELAHQWWGDLITCSDFHHIWLNEGFTTYCEALWYENYYDNITASDYQMGSNLYLGPGTIYVEDTKNDNIFDWGLTYAKGSWVMHMLRHVTGDSAFFYILQEYYKSPLHKFGSATTEDFKTLCEQLTGLELDTFFQQWIYEEGYPQYNYWWNWEVTDTGIYRVFGQIRQVQPVGPIFTMPLDITIQTKKGDTTIVCMNDTKYMDFEYLVADIPKKVLLDKDNWILKEVSGNFAPNFVIVDYSIDDSQMNNNHRIDAGETVRLSLTINNLGVRTTNVQLQLLTNDTDITITDGVCKLEMLERNAVYDSVDAPFEFSVSATAPGHMADLQLIITDDNNYMQTLSFSVALNLPNILYVDDDDGKNYETFIEALLKKSFIHYDYWDVKKSGIPDLNTAGIVIWATGDDSNSSLTQQEQLIITEFLNSGGNLLLTGQNIGYDLVEQGTSADSVFYSNVLHSSYISNRIECPILLGKTDDLLGNSMQIYLGHSETSAGNQNSTDVIMPLEPATSFLYYTTTHQCAGLHYYDEQSGARIVYLAFGLEGISLINDIQSADKLFKRSFKWFAEPAQTTLVQQSQEIPALFHLYPNYPNPFNPETRINFDVPVRGNVTLQIYNILGSQVAELINEAKSPGSYSVVWNGRDKNGINVPSGVYIYKVTAGNSTASHKMLLMR